MQSKIVDTQGMMQFSGVLKKAVLLVVALFLIACHSPPKKNYAKLQPPPRKGVQSPAFEAPEEPGILAFSDRLYFMLDTDLKWRIGETEKQIVVPSGFVSDGASVPKIFWPLGLVPYGSHGRATVVHDFLYWFQQCSRNQADNIMLIALKESGVSFFKRLILTVGVKLFGKRAWRGNADDREVGFSRLIGLESASKPMDRFSSWKPVYPYPKGSPAEPFPIPIPFTWKEYAVFLKAEGARDPVLPVPDYCRCGDSLKVPKGDDINCQ